MDFVFAPEADDAAELAATILADHTSVERQREVEAGGDRFDRSLWDALNKAFDWDDLDLVALCRVLVEVGRRVAPVPLAVHGPVRMLLAENGIEASGLLTAAIAEERSQLPSSPTVTADGDRLSGVKTLVRAGMAADAFVVTADTGVFLVDANATGVRREAQHTSDRDITALVTFDGAPGVRVGDESTATRLAQLLTIAECAELLGVTEGALRITADYAKTREQFGRPIGTFQAVAQRLADGFIDVLCQRLTLWQAAWRLSEGLDATSEVAVAKLWAADAAHRLAHTAVHVHGGVGIDLDGETHRYFSTAKRFEFALGSSTEQALTLGRELASR